MGSTFVKKTVYATASYTLRLVFHANGDGATVPDMASASTSSSAASVTVSKRIPSNTPTREGYTFLGYAYDSASASVSKQPGDNISATFSRQITGSSVRTYTSGGVDYEETTYTSASQRVTRNYYAKWKANTFEVSFDANGGSGAPAAQTKTYGEALTLSADEPTRDGYVFVGWATTPGGTAEYQAGGTYTNNEAVTLYAVWETAGSILTIPESVEIGKQLNASWDIVDPAYTYGLMVSYANASIGSSRLPAGTTSHSMTIPSSWIANVPATYAIASVSLTTFSGNTIVGTSNKQVRITVPDSVVPTITSFTASPYSENQTVSAWDVFLQGYSQADLAVVATPGTGASISSVTLSGPGISQSGSSLSGRTNILSASGANVFMATVVDSRGRTATATVQADVIPYAPPYVFGISTMRADADGTINNGSGTRLKVIPVYSKSPVDGNNEWVRQTLSVSGLPTITCASGTEYGPPTYDWQIALTANYNITVSLEDSLGNTATRTVTLPAASGLWYGQGNDRLGLGTVPPGPGLYCYWDATFKSDFGVYGDSTFGGDGTFGGNLSASGNIDASGDASIAGEASVGSLVVGGRELFKTLYHDDTGWGSGNLTVDGIRNYSLFLIKLTGGMPNIIASFCTSADGDGELLRGIGGYPPGGSSETLTSISAELNADTLTMYYCRSTGLQSGNRVNRNVTDIIGIF